LFVGHSRLEYDPSGFERLDCDGVDAPPVESQQFDSFALHLDFDGLHHSRGFD
jgi:hypothetical protein